MGKPRLNQRRLTPQPVFHPHVILEEVGQLGRSLAPATPYSTLCLQNLFPSLPRPWSRRQAPGDGWLPTAVGERSSSGTFSRSCGWESARISHWRAGASAELGEPGPRGFVSPPAALRGLRCCCYLYLWLRSSSMKSRLGICSRDTEPWLPSKLGLRRALSPRPAPRPR